MMNIPIQIYNGKKYKINCLFDITKNTKRDIAQNKEVQEIIVVEENT
jgi:hypothetical protein